MNFFQRLRTQNLDIRYLELRKKFNAKISTTRERLLNFIINKVKRLTNYIVANNKEKERDKRAKNKSNFSILEKTTIENFLIELNRIVRILIISRYLN